MVRKRILEAKGSLLGSVLGSATVTTVAEAAAVGRAHAAGVKLQYFGHLMRRVDSLEKTLMLGGIWGRRRRGQQRMMS